MSDAGEDSGGKQYDMPLRGTPRRDQKASQSSDGSDKDAPQQATSPGVAGSTTPSDGAEEDVSQQEFFLPVSGFVWLNPDEVEVVSHPAFQRLGRVYQLGQTYLLYRGATHKRFEHSLGAVSVVQRMIKAVGYNCARSECGCPLSSEEKHFVRLGALLHDIGHIAAGHTLEDELRLVGRHDGDDRITSLFEGSTIQRAPRFKNTAGQTLEALINSCYSKYLPHEISSAGVTAATLVRLLIRKKPVSAKHEVSGTGTNDQVVDPFAKQEAVVAKSTKIRLSVCRDMIGNTICADLLDYLHRDWYHIGKPRDLDDRIFQYMEIRGSACTPRESDRFVISLGKRPKIRTDAVSSILELLEWRYQLAESVLFHRTKLAAAAMLDRAFYELWGDSDRDKPTDIERELLELSDEEMLATCCKKASEAGSSGKVAEALFKALERRQLHTGLVTYFHDDFPADIRDLVQSKFFRDPNDAPANRIRALRILESEFDLPAGSLAMYCPDPNMNKKIAEVRIAFGDTIERFCDYEAKHSELSGGHLQAQLHRFTRLWRVHFFIDRSVKSAKGHLMTLLGWAATKLVLGRLGENETYDSVAKSLAYALASTPGSPFFGKPVAADSIVYARAEYTPGDAYPLGAPRISSFFEKI